MIPRTSNAIQKYCCGLHTVHRLNTFLEAHDHKDIRIPSDLHISWQLNNEFLTIALKDGGYSLNSPFDRLIYLKDSNHERDIVRLVKGHKSARKEGRE